MAFDVIVVGSGFGGSVCAARLAERGLRVLILERGPWWGPLQRERPSADRRELPRGLLGMRKLVRNVRVARRGRRSERLVHHDGLLEAHRFEHLRVITASGVGGGSHVYTAVLEEPAPDFFAAFPPELTAGEMRPYFDRVHQMLRPAAMSVLPAKDRIFDAAVRGAGFAAPELAPLAIALGENPEVPREVVNAAGVAQSTSTWHSDAFIGCEDGSKTTLDLTYLPIALRHGAELRPLCEVTAIEATAGGYAARYLDHREHVLAPRLVLAAGGLNTQRLLFAARDVTRSLPALPRTLGQRFSSNGDFAALLWRTGVGEDLSRGPAFGAFTRIGDDSAERFVLGEVGLPVAALPVPEVLRRTLRQSAFLFCMGRDASDGVVDFDGTGLVTSMARSRDASLYDAMEQAVARVAQHYEPKRLVPSFLSPRGGDGLFSVHPLGGCSIGRSIADGFTDHRGQVFGHRGLFVADGSLYPRAPGIPPSLTIAALAERQAALMS